MVSMGCDAVAAMTPAPIGARTLLTDLDTPLSSSCLTKTGHIPSTPAVYMPSRPQDMVNPRPNDKKPKLENMRMGAATMDPPNRCCWIMTSSIGPHANPESAPPANAAPIVSEDVNSLSSPLVITFVTIPVKGNWSPVSVAIFTTDVESPRYNSRGFNENGCDCWAAFFQNRMGWSKQTSNVPATTPTSPFSTGDMRCIRVSMESAMNFTPRILSEGFLLKSSVGERRVHISGARAALEEISFPRKDMSRSKKEETIEDAWESVSRFVGGLNPPPSTMVLTPRSAEACLKHGVNPEVLRVRPLESFAEDNPEPKVQRMRHETYTQRRFELMRLVRAERKRLINREERERKLPSSAKNANAKITPEQIIAQQARQSATFLEEEEKRMQKMRKRQEKELEQLLSFEAKMQEIQEERDRRLEADRRKQDVIRRQKQRRAKEMAEEQRLRDLKKASQAEAEEQRRQAQVRAMFEKEKELRAERAAREKKAKQEARLKEEERLRKQEEHRLQTQRILADQQAAIRRRMEDMEIAERERKALVDRKRAEEARRLEKRREQMEARLRRNMKQAERVEEERRDAFFRKENEHEEMRRSHLEMQERERELQRRQSELQERRRQMVLAQSRRDEERRKQELLGNLEKEDENVRRVREARERELAISHEKKMLRNQMKLENVERMRRIGEYRRLEYVRKINEADKRTKEMMERKQQLIAMRKQNALKVKVQKDKILNVMEQAKTSGSRSTTKLLQASVKEFKSGNSRPSSSSGGTKKNSRKREKIEMRSQSATDIQTEARKALGPPPEDPHQSSRHHQTDPSRQLPYVSPYEAGGPSSSKIVTF